MGYQETPGKDFATDKDANPRMKEAREISATVPGAEGMCMGQDSGRNTGDGADRKGCKRGQLCVS